MQELIRHIQQNPTDTEAQLEMCSRNEGLIRFFVNKYINYLSTRGRGPADMDDLLQAGKLAVIAAAKTYAIDAEKGSWGHWASYYIRRAIQAALNWKYRPGSNGKRCMDPGPAMLSLDEPIGNEDGSETRGELLEDPSAVDPEEEAACIDLGEQIRDCVAALPTLQAAIVYARFYEDLPLSQIAAAQGMTEQQAKNARSKALHTLGRNPSIKQLHSAYYNRD